MLNKTLIKNLGLKDDEVVLNVIYRSLWSWFWQIILATLLVLAPFFLIYPLFMLGIKGVIIFASVLLLGLILVYKIYLNHSYSVFVMTNSRIIDVDCRGFFNLSMISAIYSKIQDVNCQKRGVIKALFKLGDVYLTLTGDKTTKIKLPNIKNAEELTNEIISHQKDFFDLSRNKQDDEAKIQLKKIKEKLGEDNFNKLIAD